MIIPLVVVAAAISGVLILKIGIPTSPCANTAGTTRTFTVVGDINGFNGSRNLSAPWPVMSVQRCDSVTMRFVNEDNQAHGMAVDFYSVRGLSPQGGETQALSFTASKAGQFRVFCNIFCTVHIYMQDGLLNVS